MVNVGHEAITRLLYEHGNIPADVDVRYEAPTRDWVESLTRPTIDLFLFDIRENREKRETNMRPVRGASKVEWRMPARRMDLFHCVSVFATEVSDEHELLWRTLATLMKYQEALPEDVLPDELRRLEPQLTARFGEEGDTSRLSDIWSSLGTAPHPALCYIVTMPLDLDVSIESPLVLTRTAKYKLESDYHRRAVQIGGVVRAKSGQPIAGVTVRAANSAKGGFTTDRSGEFRLRGLTEGIVALDVLAENKLKKQVEVRVPADNYEIVLDD